MFCWEKPTSITKGQKGSCLPRGNTTIFMGRIKLERHNRSKDCQISKLTGWAGKIKWSLNKNIFWEFTNCYRTPVVDLFASFSNWQVLSNRKRHPLSSFGPYAFPLTPFIIRMLINTDTKRKNGGYFHYTISAKETMGFGTGDAFWW